eukprot:gene29697-38284_t
MSLHITGGEVLADGLIRADLVTASDAILDLDGTAPAEALHIDATGLYVLPGIVDCHGDAFERHIMPRPGVSFDVDLALRDADRAILANGITTAFHGVTWSWEPGLRGADNARLLVERIAALKPEKLVPGRGAALQTPDQVQAGLAGTRAFISDLYESVKASAAKGEDLRKVYEATFAQLQPKYGHWVIFNHCMPFDVTRAYDEATQYPDPRIWTAERDIQMWKALEG